MCIQIIHLGKTLLYTFMRILLVSSKFSKSFLQAEAQKDDLDRRLDTYTFGQYKYRHFT